MKSKDINISVDKILIVLLNLVMACQAFYQLSLQISVIIYFAILLSNILIVIVTNFKKQGKNSKDDIYTLIWVSLWLLVNAIIVEFFIEYKYTREFMGLTINVSTYYFAILAGVLIICRHVQKNNKYDKIIIISTIVSYIVNFGFTVYAIGIQENISKLMATGQEIDFFGVVGYEKVYSIIFLIPMLCTCIFNCKKLKIKIMLIMLLFSIIYFLYLCGYMTAIFLMLFGIIVSVYIKMNKRVKILLCITLILILSASFMNIQVVGELVYELSQKIDILMISERLEEISEFMLSGEQGATLGRLDLYEHSIESFKNNIFFGNMFNSQDYRYSGHAEILDILAHGGIFLITLYIFAMYYSFKNIYKICKTKEMKQCVAICIVIFIILNTINTTFTSIYIYITIFSVLPAIIREYDKQLCLDEIKQKKELS